MLVNDIYELQGMETQHAIDTDMFKLQTVFNDLINFYDKGNASLMVEHAKNLEYLGREIQNVAQSLKLQGDKNVS